MSKPVSLARHRWDNGDGKPGSHSVRMQAGKLDPYGQIGLLYRVCFLLGTGE